MSPGVHAMVGLSVIVINLVVGAWALVVARRGGGAPVPRLLTVAVALGVAVLLVQVLLGLDLWMRGGRPAAPPWGEVHLAGPVVALIVALGLLGGDGPRTAGRHAIASLVIGAVALVSYAIGEMG
jgi:cytochrome bd-type quinol oxidase subunit 1